jgi:hypothetical protein
MKGRRTHKAIIILTALLFSWIFIGQLINFHQVHVLNKTLPDVTTVFIIPKTEKHDISVVQPEIVTIDDCESKTICISNMVYARLNESERLQLRVMPFREKLLTLHYSCCLPPPSC